MVTCTDCVHYNACKVWHEHNNRVTDLLNEGYKELGSQLGISLKTIDYISFPLVAETKETLCENYAKVKENVQP